MIAINLYRKYRLCFKRGDRSRKEERAVVIGGDQIKEY